MSELQRATAPEVVPQAGWEPIEPPRLEGGHGSFVSGDPKGERLRVRYFRRGGARPLVGRAWFGPGAEGPPGHAHGGSMAAVLDEAMGAAAWMAGHKVVAVQLDTSFRRMLPLGTDAWLEAWVERVEGRKVWTASRLFGDPEPGDPSRTPPAEPLRDTEARPATLFAEARALFVTLDPERFGSLLDRVARVARVAPLAPVPPEPAR